MTNHPNRSRRGRPSKEDAGRNHTLRLPPDVIELVRAAGTQRVVEVLRAGLA